MVTNIYTPPEVTHMTQEEAKRRITRIVEICHQLLSIEITEANFRTFVALKTNFELEISQLEEESANLSKPWLASQYNIIAKACCKIYIYCWNPHVIIFMGVQLGIPGVAQDMELIQLAAILRPILSSPECKDWKMDCEHQGVTLVYTETWISKEIYQIGCYRRHMTDEHQLWIMLEHKIPTVD